MKTQHGQKKKKESDLEKDQGTGEAREKGQDLPGRARSDLGSGTIATAPHPPKPS